MIAASPARSSLFRKRGMFREEPEIAFFSGLPIRREWQGLLVVETLAARYRAICGYSAQHTRS